MVQAIAECMRLCTDLPIDRNIVDVESLRAGQLVAKDDDSHQRVQIVLGQPSFGDM
jgi:hypothetical protein